MGREADKLTPKQKLFAELVHNGDSQRAAYVTAYDANPAGSAQAQRVQANRVYRMPSVQTELKRLTDEERAAAVMSKSAKKARLMEIAERILSEGITKQGLLLPSAAATAAKIIEVIARLDGDFGDAESGTQETHLTRLRRALSKRSQGNV